MDTTILLINYNGDRDTICCVNSLNRYLNHLNILIVDNKSSDKSIMALKNSFIEQCDIVSESLYVKYPLTKYSYKSNMIYLIESNENLGFGGGNNLGIKFIIDNNLSTYIWILNNDTYIKEDSLTPLINKFNSNKNIAFVGSTLIYSFDERTVQCSGGGKYYPYIGKSRLINKGKKIEFVNEYKGKIDYISGASILTSVIIIHELGMFDETYFMYSEELDWQIRARKAGKKITYANNSVIYHKEAASSGQKSAFRAFHTNRSAMMLSLKFYPYYSLFTFVFFLLQAVLKYKTVVSSVDGLISGMSYKYKKTIEMYE